MQLFDRVLDSLAQKIHKRVQGLEQSQAFRDAGQKGQSFSVEACASENIADLMCLNFEMPITGQGERALFLDKASDSFMLNGMVKAVTVGLLTGDCVIVPDWDGHGFRHAVVDSSHFAIMGSFGDELTSVAYVVDEKRMRNGTKLQLLRLIELVDYLTETGSAKGTRYTTYVAKDGTVTDQDPNEIEGWECERQWMVPNTERLLVARFKSHVCDENDPNAMKGTPLCYGASDPIREIRYLVNQMHMEFELSEKAILADRRMFKRTPIEGKDGVVKGYRLELPKGRERLFMDFRKDGEKALEEWAPQIQLQPYLDALEAQYKRVEHLIGVDAGILSNPNDMNYMNVDNVRKSTIHTQSFVSAARKRFGIALDQLVYCWDTLANYYGIGSPSPFEVKQQWSDDYINTFADMQNAILAGESIGATDAVDYRMFVLGETPEQAKQRVAEIKEQPAALAVV